VCSTESNGSRSGIVWNGICCPVSTEQAIRCSHSHSRLGIVRRLVVDSLLAALAAAEHPNSPSDQKLTNSNPQYHLDIPGPSLTANVKTMPDHADDAVNWPRGCTRMCAQLYACNKRPRNWMFATQLEPISLDIILSRHASTAGGRRSEICHVDVFR